MKIKNILITIIISLIFYLFSSCNENSNSITSNSNENNDGDNVTTVNEKKEGTELSKTTASQFKYPYGYIYVKITSPAPHHFISKKGELYYGAYNDEHRVFFDCKNKYGCTGVVTNIYYITTAHNAGFTDNDKIFSLVNSLTKVSEIDAALNNGVKNFLFDEIGHAGILFTLFRLYPLQEIKQNGGLLYADDYCPGYPRLKGYYDLLVNNLHSLDLAGIGCDKYWSSSDIVGKDPRDHWQYLRDRADTLFNFVWISTTDINRSHWVDLLTKAADFNLKVFIYPGNGKEFYNMADFCHAAFQTGWLREFDQRTIYTYKCINRDGTDYGPVDAPSSWRVFSVVPQSPFEIFN